MEVNKALQLLQQLIDVAVKAGLFKSSAEVLQVQMAHNSIVDYLKNKEDGSRQLRSDEHQPPKGDKEQ